MMLNKPIYGGGGAAAWKPAQKSEKSFVDFSQSYRLDEKSGRAGTIVRALTRLDTLVLGILVVVNIRTLVVNRRGRDRS